MTLYKFTKLKNKLNELGFPSAKGEYKALQFELDENTFKRIVNDGTIKFKSDGIYITYQGVEWRGYMYMPTYHVKEYGKLPSFHITECSTIKNLYRNGFKHLYRWSNTETNDIVERDNPNIIYPNKILELCSNCKTTQNNRYNTSDYHKLIKKEFNETIITDNFGYTLDWDSISRNVKDKRGYKCNKCSIKITDIIDRRFIHTHHIDGNKTNNNESNLECLCILCHSQIDPIHLLNFSSRRMKRELNEFIEKYKK